MPVFQIRQRRTDAILWTGSASNETRALDAMAHEAGYYDESDLPESVRRGGLVVEALNFQPTGSTGRAGERVTGGRPIAQVGKHTSSKQAPRSGSAAGNG